MGGLQPGVPAAAGAASTKEEVAGSAAAPARDRCRAHALFLVIGCFPGSAKSLLPGDSVLGGPQLWTPRGTGSPFPRRFAPENHPAPGNLSLGPLAACPRGMGLRRQLLHAADDTPNLPPSFRPSKHSRGVPGVPLPALPAGLRAKLWRSGCRRPDFSVRARAGQVLREQR